MSPYLRLNCRTLEEAMRETITDRIDACQSIAEQISALRAKAKAWAGDDLEDALHYLDEAAAAAKVSADRLQDQVPAERPYISSRAL